MPITRDLLGNAAFMNMDSEKKVPPLFIVGCDRSGTTLLRLMLIQSPVLHIPGESNFFAVLWDRRESYGDLTRDYERWFFIRDLETNDATPKTLTFPIFNLTVQEAETLLAEVAPTNFPGAVDALYQASARKLNKQRWGDKTPAYVLSILRLSEAFPGAKFVHVIRDGRDVAMSMCKAGWQQNVSRAARYWKERVLAGRAAGTQLGENLYRELRYEQLVIDTEKTLGDLCHWLELDYTPKMLEYYHSASEYIPTEFAGLFKLASKPPDSSRAYAWKNEFNKCRIAEFELVAGDALREFNYEVTRVHPPLRISEARILKKILEFGTF